MYELAETADQELKARSESQQAYIPPRRLSRGEFVVSPALKGANGKIKETITADRIRANNITMYLANQEVVGIRQE